MFVYYFFKKFKKFNLLVDYFLFLIIYNSFC